MSKYGEYRHIDLPWLKEIPAHWDIWRNKNIFTEIKEEVGKNASSYTLLSLTLNGIVPRDVESGKGKFPEKFDKYKVVKPGYMAFCLFDIDETPRTVGLSSFDGMLTGAYTIMRVDNINPRFAYYYYLSLDNAKAMRPLYSGLRKTINVGVFQGTKMPIPPKEEQDAIASFLDWQISKVNRLIDLKKKEISKLTELKKTVVNKAVTHGLNPNVPMKLSGVEWLGEIPAHWTTIKLRQILHPFSEKNHPELPLLSVVREQGVIIRNVESKEENHNYVPDDLSNYKLVKQGQFTMNKMKAWQGSYGVSKYDGIVSPAYFVFNLKCDINRDFFNAAIRSKAYVNYFGQASDGIRVGQWDLSMARMKDIPLLVPPREEQDQIVRFLDWKVSNINKLINIKKKEIKAIDALKRSMVSHAITRGLTTDAPMKDSGVKWLGDIPAHWKITKLRQILHPVSEKNHP